MRLDTDIHRIIRPYRRWQLRHERKMKQTDFPRRKGHFERLTRRKETDSLTVGRASWQLNRRFDRHRLVAQILQHDKCLERLPHNGAVRIYPDSALNSLNGESSAAS